MKRIAVILSIMFLLTACGTTPADLTPSPAPETVWHVSTITIILNDDLSISMSCTKLDTPYNLGTFGNYQAALDYGNQMATELIKYQETGKDVVALCGNITNNGAYVTPKYSNVVMRN